MRSITGVPPASPTRNPATSTTHAARDARSAGNRSTHAGTGSIGNSGDAASGRSSASITTGAGPRAPMPIASTSVRPAAATRIEPPRGILPAMNRRRDACPSACGGDPGRARGRSPAPRRQRSSRRPSRRCCPGRCRAPHASRHAPNTTDFRRVWSHTGSIPARRHVQQRTADRHDGPGWDRTSKSPSMHQALDWGAGVAVAPSWSGATALASPTPARMTAHVSSTFTRSKATGTVRSSSPEPSPTRVRTGILTGSDAGGLREDEGSTLFPPGSHRHLPVATDGTSTQRLTELRTATSSFGHGRPSLIGSGLVEDAHQEMPVPVVTQVFVGFVDDHQLRVIEPAADLLPVG